MCGFPRTRNACTHANTRTTVPVYSNLSCSLLELLHHFATFLFCKQACLCLHVQHIMHNACANVRHIATYTTGEMLLKHYVKTASICISRLYVYLFIFIYSLCHIYPGVPHQCAALFSLGLLHYMHDKTNINHHTFRYNTVTTLTTWYIRYIITCIMLTIYTCSSLQWLHAGAGSCLINVMYLINVTFDIIAVS